MVEQFIDVRMASISIDEIANEQVNDTIGESSFLGGLSGDATVATISGFKLVNRLSLGIWFYPKIMVTSQSKRSQKLRRRSTKTVRNWL